MTVTACVSESSTMLGANNVSRWILNRCGRAFSLALDCPRDTRLMFGSHRLCTTAIAPNLSSFVSKQRIHLRILVPQLGFISVLGTFSYWNNTCIVCQDDVPRLHGPVPHAQRRPDCPSRAQSVSQVGPSTIAWRLPRTVPASCSYRPAARSGTAPL